ncbi:hypothetical protein [Streptomyces sp. NPDC101166]|uniref:hypothetical protein n=1 Tax=Streptomyces sp. NPDC101166 TaxID=3366120 RepID=UPI0037F96816
MPQGTKFPITPNQGDEEDDLIEVLMTVAVTAAKEPDSAAATVPILLEVLADQIRNIKRLTFESDLDPLAIQLREEATHAVGAFSGDTERVCRPRWRCCAQRTAGGAARPVRANIAPTTYQPGRPQVMQSAMNSPGPRASASPAPRQRLVDHVSSQMSVLARVRAAR